ncbi:MAG: DUF58 domain-containing protein [Planctomycetota bacterium]
MAADAVSQYLDPRELSKIARLEIRARLIVEGFISGVHKSPYHGASVEFAEHREYVPGDDIRHIDWKVYARSDRYYIKQYEEETNLRTQIVLDASESMNFGSGAMTKLEYGRTLAAALAFLILKQRDAVGALVFDENVRAQVPISSNPTHLRNLVSVIAEEPGKDATDLGEALARVGDRVKNRSLIILISDLFDDPEKVRLGLRRLRHDGHEVMLFHVMDSEELEFPFQRMTMFEGMEGNPDLLADPNSLRDAYLAEIQSFINSVKKSCRNNRVDYALVDTSQRFDVVMTEFLARRTGSMR